MADLRHSSNGPATNSEEGFDIHLIPDYDREFISEEHLASFVAALGTPESLPPPYENEFGGKNGVVYTNGKAEETRVKSRAGFFIRVQNDWAPVVPKKLRIRDRKVQRKRKRTPQRSSDETREGHFYTLLKWPLLATIFAWIIALCASYLLTRLYIWLYEYYVAWRGQREDLRKKLHSATNYADWVVAAKKLDEFLGNDKWKRTEKYAYYDYKTTKGGLGTN